MEHGVIGEGAGLRCAVARHADLGELAVEVVGVGGGVLAAGGAGFNDLGEAAEAVHDVLLPAAGRGGDADGVAFVEVGCGARVVGLGHGEGAAEAVVGSLSA